MGDALGFAQMEHSETSSINASIFGNTHTHTHTLDVVMEAARPNITRSSVDPLSEHRGTYPT